MCKAGCQQEIPVGQIFTAPTITIMSGHEAGLAGVFICPYFLFQGNVLRLWQLNRAGGDCLEWDFSKR